MFVNIDDNAYGIMTTVNNLGSGWTNMLMKTVSVNKRIQLLEQ